MSRAADILLRLGDTTPIVPTNGQISFYAKSNGVFYSLNSDGVETPLSGGGGAGVTSIDVSGGATGLTTIGGPVTSSGTITLSGTLFETHGGTGISTYTAGDILYASDVNTLSKRAIGTDGQVLTVSGGIPTWSTPATGGSVTSISITSNNGFAGTVADSTTTPAITLSTTVTGMIKGNGAAISAAVSGLDYSAGTSALSTGLLKSTTSTGELTIATANDLNTTFGTQTANYIYAAPNGSAGNPAFRAIVAADIPTLNQNTTGTAANVTEIVTELHGGTGTSSYVTGDILYASSTNTLSKRNIGTDGQVLTVSGGIPTWSTISGTGTVTSIEVSGGTTGLTTTGGPITTTGTITLGGTLTIENGGTGATTQQTALNALSGTQVANRVLRSDGTNTSFAQVALGSDVSGTLPISNGGTGATTQQLALNALSGTQVANRVLRSDGTNTSFAQVALESDVTGTLAIANGGSGATTASGARTNFGATTVGSNVFTLTDPNEVTYLRVNADNSVSTLSAASFRTAIGAGTSSTIGTVTSIDVSGGTTGLTTTGGAVTESGTITLGGTLAITNGGTGATTQQAALNALSGTQVANRVLRSDGTNTSFSQVALGSDVTGTLPITNGGSGATTASGARTNFGATTVGSNLFTLSDPNAVTYLRVNADNSVSALDAATFRTAIGAGTSSTTGTVTSVDVSGGTTGLTTSGGAVTGSGTITLAGTLAISHGGTGATTQQAALNALSGTQVANRILRSDGTNVSLSQVALESDVTGTLSIANGGTGATTSTTAFNALAPSQTGNNGKFLTTDGTNTSWTTVSGTGTVTSIDISGGTTGLTTTGGPVTGSGVITLAGTLAIVNGGTGATSASVARTNFGATTVGGNFFTLSDPSAITFPRINADNSVSALDAATFRTAIGAGTGTVTSVGISGGTTGLTTSGGPITSSGTVTLAGTLAVANGGTGATTSTTAFNALAPTQTGNTGKFLTTDGTTTSWATISGTGTVTSVAMTVPAFLSVTGSPITSSGTLAVSLSGSALPIANGGSGATTAQVARTNFGATTVGSNLFTLTNPSAVTYLRVNADNTVSALDANSFRTAIGAGTVTSVGVSGGTTGLTTTGGPVTGSGVITLAGTLAIANGGTGATTQSGAANAILPSQTGNTGKVLTTDGSTVSWSTVSGSGTVTSVSATGSNGVTVTGSPITTSGTISIGLGNITPINVAATGTVTGTNLSGTNTGDQTITLTGDVTGSGTGSFTTTLANSGVTAGVYGSSTEVPVITVDEKGRITNVSNTAISGTGSSAPEIVVWHYGSGGSGTFAPADVLYSQTSGVTATVTDAANCIATYSFTGKSNLPKSMTFYGQVYTTNAFSVKMTTSLPNATIAGGGTAATPDLISGLFSASNIVTLQTRLSDVGASAGLGQRAWLIIVFGF